MHSRAFLLIERDYQRLCSNAPWGIEAQPVSDDNLFEWIAKVRGLKDTLWEGGVFQLHIKFDEYYNNKPPEVCFHTIPFHPNVDSTTGRPCIDFLEDHAVWNVDYGLGFILLSVQSLLSSPTLENAVNQDAATMLLKSRQSYHKLIHDCVAASQRLEAGLQLDKGSSDASKVRFGVTEEAPAPVPTTNPTPLKVKKMSFEDYHRGWSGIATSKTHPNTVNPLLEVISGDPVLEQVHFGLAREDIEQQIKKQLQDHSKLIYGRFKKGGPQSEEELEARIAKLHQMRKIYLPGKNPVGTAPPSRLGNISRQETPAQASKPTVKNIDDPWEKDVDELLDWTTKLDDAVL